MEKAETTVEVGPPLAAGCKKPAVDCKLESSETDEKEALIKKASLINKTNRVNEYYDQWCSKQLWKPMLFLVVSVAAMIVCAFVCQPCLFGVLVFSAVLCNCMPVLQITLVGSMLILLFQGWSWTNGHFAVIWS